MNKVIAFIPPKKCLYDIEDKGKGQAVPGEILKLLGDSV